MSEASKHRVGFIGAGQMATALARGLATSGFTDAGSIMAFDVLPEALDRFGVETGARTVDSAAEVFSTSEIVILAVKPQQIHDVLADAKDHVTREHVVVSIVAGVSLAALTRGLGNNQRVVRVMPNTPCLVGAAASAFSLGGAAESADGRLVERMLSSVGIAVEVPETLLDAVTGLSGSGPAYAFQIIEALSDGGVRAGLPRDVATRLAAQTLLGAARMVLEMGAHPAALKDAVTSPGGTTIAGLHALEEGGLRGILIDAVVAATERSLELGQSS